MSTTLGAVVAPVPGTSMCKQAAKKRPATVHTAVTTLTPGMHAAPSTGTYGNGVALGAVDTNDNAAAEKIIEIMEMQAVNDTNAEGYDNDPASVPGKSIEVIECEEGKEYLLKGANLSIAKGQYIIRAASGLFAGVNVAHNATPLPKLCFQCTQACTTSTYVWAKYVGTRTVYTA